MDSEREKRWSQAQRKEDAFWKREGVLEPEMERVISRYRPVIDRISQMVLQMPLSLMSVAVLHARPDYSGWALRYLWIP
jgi:hypothetical protein